MPDTTTIVPPAAAVLFGTTRSPPAPAVVYVKLSGATVPLGPGGTPNSKSTPLSETATVVAPAAPGGARHVSVEAPASPLALATTAVSPMRQCGSVPRWRPEPCTLTSVPPSRGPWSGATRESTGGA